MLVLHIFSHRKALHALRILCIAVLLAGCQTGVQPNLPASPTSQNQAPERAAAEVTFHAQVPTRLANGQSLYMEVLDEVTGLAINPARAKLSSTDGLTYTIKIPFAVGSTIKYRYLRDPDPVGVEYTSLGQQVRYRMVSVDGPGVIEDTITAWKSEPAAMDGLGRIQGQVANKNSQAPVVNALVTAGGIQSLTASDGSFLLEGLPSGTHNLVVTSLDGSFRPFHQGAVVAPDSTTPALVLLNPATTVNVTFVVHPPQDHLRGLPIRLVGNIYPLGNTFADLRGGMNVLASRAPLMAAQADGSYALTMRLPVGLDLRYKYTLGDGFWNAEHATSGGFRVRQLIVPAKDTRVNDSVDTWQTSQTAPITFTVTVPDTTPVSDTIAIQFNPFGWTEPIPMWPTGKNRWMFILYSPLNAIGDASYRYCRNEQCDVALPGADAGDIATAQGKSFKPRSSPQTFEDTISSWAWWDAKTEPVVVPSTSIQARGADFQAGVAFLPGYQPNQQPYRGWAFQNAKDQGANTVILSPTWHITHATPPVIELLPGQDALWPDMTQLALQAQQKGLATGIQPLLRFNTDAQTWWSSAPRDAGWWQSWFGQYRTFLIYHADMAAQTGAKVLILGDPAILPALPDGSLPDGSASGVPADASARWKQLIADVRGRFPGKIAWQVSYDGAHPPITPDFLTDFDLLFVQFTPPVLQAEPTDQAALDNQIAVQLDAEILTLQQKIQKPVLLGLRYPSARVPAGDCTAPSAAECPPDVFQNPAPVYAPAQIAMKDQANVYSALLTYVNQHAWITGFYAMDYFAPVELKDGSTSVRAKPAGDVLWYWYPRLTAPQ